MKTVTYCVSFLALVVVAIVGCQKGANNLVSLQEMKNTSMDDFLEAVTKMDLETDNKENGIYINYEWDKAENTISVLKVEEKELDFFPLISKTEITHRSSDRNFTVECINGDESWTKNCDGKGPCGGLVGECLDKGSCAAICEQQMIYLPLITTFLLRSNRLSSSATSS